MLSQPVTFSFFKLTPNFVSFDQLPTLRSGVAFCDFGAVFSKPRFVFVEQFEGSFDHFLRIVINAGTQDFSDQLFVLRLQRDGHEGLPWLQPTLGPYGRSSSH